MWRSYRLERLSICGIRNSNWYKLLQFLQMEERMIRAMTILLLYQLAGEVLARAVRAPVPGPVVGMVLLFVTLLLRRGIPADLEMTAQRLLQYLSLLFVPAGVGVMVHLQLLQSEWLPILATLLASTIVTLSVTALTLSLLLRLAPARREPETGHE
jgi:holin-like protein